MKLEYTYKWGIPKAGGAVWGGITGTLNNQLDLKAELDTIKGNVTTNTAGLAMANQTFTQGTEYDSGQKLGDKIIYQKLVGQGNIKSNVDIPATGDMIASGVETFLGIEWGVISRKNTLQLHNINCINNAPDQHSSVIFQEGNKISWYYASNMSLTSFKNRPFLALIKFTKTI